jgi:hypothetical protein
MGVRDEAVDVRGFGGRSKGEARGSPVRFLDVPHTIRIRHGAREDRSSSRWEGDRGRFTINTEDGEEPCIPYLHIFGATPMSFVLLTVVLAMVMVALVLFLYYVLRRCLWYRRLRADL